MSDSRRGSHARARGSATRGGPAGARAPRISLVRTVLAILLVVAGLVWMVVYLNLAQDGEQLARMGDLGGWNYVIGFGLVLLGLSVSAHPSTPAGRGRGVVIGMLSCFLLGLAWIVLYYLAGGVQIPLITDLQQYNLIVGIGFMGVGFLFATHWE